MTYSEDIEKENEKLRERLQDLEEFFDLMYGHVVSMNSKPASFKTRTFKGTLEVVFVYNEVLEKKFNNLINCNERFIP